MGWLRRGRYYRAGISPLVRPVRRWWRQVRYWGNAVECPVCEGTFRSWVWGDTNGLCPFCESQTRHRLLAMHLKAELAGTGPRIRALHFAPEYCMSRFMRRQPRLEYVTADLYEPGAMLKLDITNIDLPDHSFDLILCSHVLEHIPDDRRAMRELRRVLKPGGVLLLQVPQNNSMATTYEDWSITSRDGRETAFGQWDHVRVYGADFADRLQEAGLDVTRVRLARDLSPEARQRLGMWDDSIYRCASALNAPRAPVEVAAVHPPAEGAGVDVVSDGVPLQ